MFFYLFIYFYVWIILYVTYLINCYLKYICFFLIPCIALHSNSFIYEVYIFVTILYCLMYINLSFNVLNIIWKYIIYLIVLLYLNNTSFAKLTTSVLVLSFELFSISNNINYLYIFFTIFFVYISHVIFFQFYF